MVLWFSKISFFRYMFKTYCAPVYFTDHAKCDLRVISKNSSRSLGVVHFTSQETSTVQWPARLQLATGGAAGRMLLVSVPLRSYRRPANGNPASKRIVSLRMFKNQQRHFYSIETRAKLKGDGLECEVRVRSSVHSEPIRSCPH